jgi:predicted RNA-binding protein with RPS1 domain
MDNSVVTEELEQKTDLRTKTHYRGKVVKTSLAGAVIDIGQEQPAVIHISQLQSPNPEEQIKGVEDVLKTGEEYDFWVRKITKEGRIELTMIQPLDLEWRDLKKGLVVKGTVVRLEKFGAFVEIGAERPGLIHISEMAHGYVRQPSDVVKEGDEVEAQVLDFNRKKKQIKLSLKALQPEPVKEEPPARTAMEPAARREKPVRRTKKPRRDTPMGDDTQLLESLQSSTPAEAEPTFMEIALREAMEKAKTRKEQAEAKRKNRAVSVEQADILSRTLESKPKTA